MILALAAVLQVLPDAEAVHFPPLQARSGDWAIGVCAGVQGRAVLPFGFVEDGFVTVVGNVVVIDDHLSYHDLFDPGLGVTLEFDILFRPPPPRPGGPPWEDTPAMGVYLAFERDRFGGDSAKDEAGVTIRPDDWDLTSVFAGFKAQGTVEGPLYGDVRVGLGWVSYPSLDADFSVQGGPSGRGELFAESDGLAFESRMHFGWRFGPLAFNFGFGGRFMIGPDAGPAMSLDPGPLWTLELELGAELNF